MLLPHGFVPLSLWKMIQPAVKGLFVRLSLWKSFLLLFSCQEARVYASPPPDEVLELPACFRCPSARSVGRAACPAGSWRGSWHQMPAEITLLIGRNVLKLISTVISFRLLLLLSVGEVSPWPLPCKPCSVVLLVPNCLLPPRRASCHSDPCTEFLKHFSAK